MAGIRIVRLVSIGVASIVLLLVQLGVWGEYGNFSTLLKGVVLVCAAIAGASYVITPVLLDKRTRELRSTQETASSEKAELASQLDVIRKDLNERLAATNQYHEERRQLRKLLRSIFQIVSQGAPSSVDQLSWSVVALVVSEDGRDLQRVASWTNRSVSKTPINFCEGKGVVGTALQLKKSVSLNLDRDDVRSAVAASTPDLWDALPEETIRMGLSFDEIKMIGEYTSVFATPIFATHSQTDVIGIISVTGPKNSFSHLRQQRENITTLASTATAHLESLRTAQTVLGGE